MLSTMDLGSLPAAICKERKKGTLCTLVSKVSQFQHTDFKRASESLNLPSISLVILKLAVTDVVCMHRFIRASDAGFIFGSHRI
jgi:hypothetical protein